jgi:hypothetical protein
MVTYPTVPGCLKLSLNFATNLTYPTVPGYWALSLCCVTMQPRKAKHQVHHCNPKFANVKILYVAVRVNWKRHGLLLPDNQMQSPSL